MLVALSLKKTTLVTSTDQTSLLILANIMNVKVSLSVCYIFATKRLAAEQTSMKFDKEIAHHEDMDNILKFLKSEFHL